jgi:hypothetical protein
MAPTKVPTSSSVTPPGVVRTWSTSPISVCGVAEPKIFSYSACAAVIHRVNSTNNMAPTAIMEPMAGEWRTARA